MTTPILDPRTGREREVVDAFTLSYDNRVPEKAQDGANGWCSAFLAEHRRQRQGRASNAAEFYSKEAERLRTHVARLESKLADFKRANSGQLPELTEVNMSMMDRTESQLDADHDTQMSSLRQERVFLAAQLEQTRAAGPRCRRACASSKTSTRACGRRYDESHPDMVALRRQIDSLKYGTSAGAGTSACVRSSTRSAPRSPKRASATARSIRTSSACSATSRRSRRASRTASSGDVEMSDGTPVGMQLRTQINAIDSQLGSLGAQNAELRAKMAGLEKNVTAAPQVEREYANAHARPDHRAREIRAAAQPADGCRSERGGDRRWPRRRVPPRSRRRCCRASRASPNGWRSC